MSDAIHLHPEFGGDDSDHELDVVWRMGEIPCPRCGEPVTAYFSPEGLVKQQDTCWSCPPFDE